MRLVRRLRPRGLAVGFVIGLAVGGTLAYAAIPDAATGRITACYPTSGPNKGKLAVIDAPAGQSCAAGEAALSWQQRPFCVDWPHPGVDYSMPGSTPGNGCNFTGLRFPEGDVTNGNFTNANLTRANMFLISTGANFTGANLTDAAVPNDFTNADLRSAYKVVGIDLDGFTMSGWDLSGLDLTGANLNSGHLAGANLSGSTLARATFGDSDLTGANLTGANLAGVRWQNTTCPDGTNSDSHANTCAGHLTG